MFFFSSGANFNAVVRWSSASASRFLANASRAFVLNAAARRADERRGAGRVGQRRDGLGEERQNAQTPFPSRGTPRARAAASRGPEATADPARSRKVTTRRWHPSSTGRSSVRTERLAVGLCLGQPHHRHPAPSRARPSTCGEEDAKNDSSPRCKKRGTEPRDRPPRVASIEHDRFPERSRAYSYYKSTYERASAAAGFA